VIDVPKSGEGMRRRRKWFQRISKGVATLAIGSLLGFLVPTIARDLSPQPVAETRVPESPVGRQFINAFTADDQGVLTSMGVSADTKLRASRFRAQFQRVEVPIHLGSYVAGGFSLHAYTAHVVLNDGTEEIRGWRVATAGGQALLIAPPSSIEEP
jgi:hypothetical protein